MANDTGAYVGGELALFARAENWKRYFGEQIAPYIRGSVLEVGAGMGGTTRMLLRRHHARWKCLEPDPELARELAETAKSFEEPGRVEVACGTLEDLDDSERFDTIIYIDVLEHIEDDRGELERASRHVRPGGTIVVLSPAHQALYTPFDAAIGHHRRYDTRSLSALAPRGFGLEQCFFLDSVGMLASLGNRLLLSQSMPTEGQVRFWDSILVPLSRHVDGLVRRRIGKSIVAVWRAPQ